ncbi:hypothetical protein [Bacillus sp. B1-b2]|uniref:hypothetical protein n=1 Tax=Bacillus sp. B1-b2 TaxID=2653201 RepID=UPI00126264EB|nr:hypothetical protein [Bacillus sp. B1-b2]KAB7671698.1 hypothetical protein F9279_05095 [Bacillus sp. B1-b2]
MEKYKYIFIVLVYRNAEDLDDFVESVKKNVNGSYRIVIVNSYFDEDSKNEIEETAERNDCDFLNVDNKGYGYGNNRGIEFANNNYSYDYLIISNPDIVIQKFDCNVLDKKGLSVVGPLILTKTNKSQNPYWFIENYLAEYLIYKGYKKRNKLMIYSGIIINKFIRESLLLLFKVSKHKYKKVFALHGSFVIFTKESLLKLGLPYNEKMFLFAEEQFLAHILKREQIPSHIVKDIKVLHKEDGSMSLSKISVKEEARKSVVTYYEELLLK